MYKEENTADKKLINAENQAEYFYWPLLGKRVTNKHASDPGLLSTVKKKKECISLT